jgi:DNA-binding response OmpR family regulator
MAASSPLVLICDDEPALRELVRVSLGPDYRYREAATVAEAMDAIGQEVPDIVVLDLMIVGGSGRDVLQAIRSDSSFEKTRVLVVSAWSDESHREAVMQEGADAFVPKPFAPESLAEQVADLLVSARTPP